MILQIGTHKRRNGEVEVSITKKSLRTDADTPWAHEETWALNGMIVSQTGSLTYIKSQTAALEAAFVDGLDVKLLFPDGSTVSHHALISADCVGGVRVMMPPQYQDGKGPQGVTYRTWQAQVTAIVPIPVGQLNTGLRSFTETITRSGGGPRQATIETLTGPPVVQLLRKRTSYKVTQQGSAVGIYVRPQAPPAIWPSALAEGNPVITVGTPRRIGDNYVDWPISWQYTFDSPVPLLGGPNIWGVTY